MTLPVLLPKYASFLPNPYIFGELLKQAFNIDLWWHCYCQVQRGSLWWAASTSIWICHTLAEPPEIQGKEWAKKTDTFLFCKVSQRKIFFHNAKCCHFLFLRVAHFYDLLSNFPFKIPFLLSTGHHPQKYHIHPSSDWIFEWLFWSLALSPWSLISRDQQTGSYNLQTGLNHNSALRKYFED